MRVESPGPLPSPVFDYYFPSGTSFKNLVHFSQNAGEDEIRDFDYGPEVNLKKYDDKKPPLLMKNDMK